MGKKKTAKIDPETKIVQSVMAVSAAIFDLNAAVTEFEKNGGRQKMTGNPGWLPFLEAIERLEEEDNGLKPLAYELFSGPFDESEAAYDREKERAAARSKK